MNLVHTKKCRCGRPWHVVYAPTDLGVVVYGWCMNCDGRGPQRGWQPPPPFSRFWTQP